MAVYCAVWPTVSDDGPLMDNPVSVSVPGCGDDGPGDDVAPKMVACTETAMAAPAVTTSRGALLFATKGCVGCHTHASFPNAHMNVGPDLTAVADRAGTRVAGLDARAYIRQSLREPGAYRVAGYSAVMPDLRLTDEQIDSLTVFLLASSR